MRPVGVCTRRLQIQNVKLRCWNWIAWNEGVWMSERESRNGMKASAPQNHCANVRRVETVVDSGIYLSYGGSQ